MVKKRYLQLQLLLCIIRIFLWVDKMTIKYAYVPNSLLTGEQTNTAVVSGGKVIETGELVELVNGINPLLSTATTEMVLSTLATAITNSILNGDRVNVTNFFSVGSSFSGRYSPSESPTTSNLEINMTISSTLVSDIRGNAVFQRVYTPAKTPIVLEVYSLLPNGFGPFMIVTGSNLRFNQDNSDEGVFFANTFDPNVLSRVPVYSKNSGAEIITTSFVPSDASLEFEENEWEVVVKTRYTPTGSVRRTDSGIYFRSPLGIDVSYGMAPNNVFTIPNDATTTGNSINKDTYVVSADGDYKVAIILAPDKSGTVTDADNIDITVVGYDATTGLLDSANQVVTSVPCSETGDLLLDANVSNGSGVLSKLGLVLANRTDLANAINSRYKGQLIEYVDMQQCVVPAP
jgi:hypothetical protein